MDQRGNPPDVRSHDRGTPFPRTLQWVVPPTDTYESVAGLCEAWAFPGAGPGEKRSRSCVGPQRFLDFDPRPLPPASGSAPPSRGWPTLGGGEAGLDLRRRSRGRARSRGSGGPSFLATASVVPLPPNGSRTTSPGFEQARMIRPRSCSGIWQPCQPARSLKVPQTRGKYQVSLVGGEAVGDVLRAEDPGVVGEPALGVGPRVGVDQLPRRGDADRLVVEGEPLGVLHEVEQVGVAAAELLRAVDPERVVPDHPAPQRQAQLAVEDAPSARRRTRRRSPARTCRSGLSTRTTSRPQRLRPVEVLARRRGGRRRRRNRSRC